MKMSRKSLHPSFQKKRVLQLDCRSCGKCVCDRGMRAILLADTNVELYSTDLPPQLSVDLANDTYCTEKCKCRIKDVACLGCGNIVGYNVVLPCRSCLESCNNGHFWMFHSLAVEAMNRVDSTGSELLVWGMLVDEEENGNSKKTKDFSEEEECFR